MRKPLACGIVLAAALVFSCPCGHRDRAVAADASEPQLVHSVYFTLKDRSDASRKKLVADCKKYLSKHPGTVYFAAGTLAEGLNRPINDRDFDVALHLVFKNKAAHDKYQDAADHKRFIEENKDSWAKVRVFDSLVEP